MFRVSEMCGSRQRYFKNRKWCYLFIVKVLVAFFVLLLLISWPIRTYQRSEMKDMYEQSMNHITKSPTAHVTSWPYINSWNISKFSISIDAFTIDVWWNFDKMHMIFKVIAGSSGHTFWWERTVLHSMETVVARWSGSLGKYQSQKRYLLWYAKVLYVT